MNDAITLITDEKEDLQTLISAAKCFWILCCIRNSIPIYRKKPPVSMVFPKWAHEIICPDQRFFSFPVRGQIIHYAVQGRRALFGSLYFFLQLLKSCITDCMFYPASILLRRFPIITSNHKFMRKFFALHSTWQHISRLSSKARHVCQILQFCRPPQQVSDLHFSRWTMCEQS